MAEDFNNFEWMTCVNASLVSIGARACAVVLFQHFGFKTGKCYVGQTTIASMTMVSTKTVRTWLAELEENGLISRSGKHISATFKWADADKKMAELAEKRTVAKAKKRKHTSAPKKAKAEAGFQKEEAGFPLEKQENGSTLPSVGSRLPEKRKQASDITNHNKPLELRAACMQAGQSISTHDLPQTWVVDEAAKFGVTLKPAQGDVICRNALAAGLTVDEMKTYVTDKLAELAHKPPRFISKVLVEDAGKWKAARAPNAKMSRVPYSHVEPDPIEAPMMRWIYETDEEFIEAHTEWEKLCRAQGIDPKTKCHMSESDKAIIEGARQ